MASYDRLKRLETVIHPPNVIVVAVHHPMVAVPQHPAVSALIVGGHHAPVTHHIERFEGVHAEGIHFTEGARMPAPDASTDGHARILDDRQAVAAGDPHQCMHVRGASRPMYRQNASGFPGDRTLDQVEVNLIAFVAVQ